MLSGPIWPHRTLCSPQGRVAGVGGTNHHSPLLTLAQRVFEATSNSHSGSLLTFKAKPNRLSCNTILKDTLLCGLEGRPGIISRELFCSVNKHKPIGPTLETRGASASVCHPSSVTCCLSCHTAHGSGRHPITAGMSRAPRKTEITTLEITNNYK